MTNTARKTTLSQVEMDALYASPSTTELTLSLNDITPDVAQIVDIYGEEIILTEETTTSSPVKDLQDQLLKQAQIEDRFHELHLEDMERVSIRRAVFVIAGASCALWGGIISGFVVLSMI